MTAEGFLPFRGLRTWHRIVGDLDAATDGQLPLLLLHGRPGFPSDPFESLEPLARSGRPVIRYDQIGCGRSDRPHDPSWWTVETFVDELATVRRELGLDEVHLLGWSWGEPDVCLGPRAGEANLGGRGEWLGRCAITARRVVLALGEAGHSPTPVPR